MQASKIMSTVKKGIYWNLIRTILERGLMFAQQIVLAWILIPETFGEFASIASILAVCSLFSVWGIGEVLTNRYDNFSKIYPEINSIYLGLILFSFIFFIVGATFQFGFDKNYLMAAIIYSISIPFLGLKSIDTTILNIQGSYSLVSKARIFYSIILVFTSIILAYIGLELLALILGATVASIFEFIILRNKTKLSLKISKNYPLMKSLFIESSYLLGYNLSWRFINFLDFILIGILLDSKRAGLYFMAFNLSVQFMNLFISYMPSVLFSSSIREKLTLKNTYLRVQKVTLFLTLITIPFYIMLYFYSDFLISLALDQNWSGVIPILQILCLAMIPRVIFSQWYLSFLTQKKYRELSILSLRYLISFLLIFTLGTHIFGLQGSAYSILIFYLSTVVLSKEYMFNNNPYLKEILILIFSGMLSFLIFRFFLSSDNSLINLILGTIFSTLLYCLTIYLLCNKTKKLVIGLVKKN